MHCRNTPAARSLVRAGFRLLPKIPTWDIGGALSNCQLGSLMNKALAPKAKKALGITPELENSCLMVGCATYARCERWKIKTQNLRFDPDEPPSMNGTDTRLTGFGRISTRPGGHGICPRRKPKSHAAVHKRFSTPGSCAVRRVAP